MAIKVTTTGQTTFVKKVVVGTPIREVNSNISFNQNSISGLKFSNVKHKDLLVYDSSQQKWINSDSAQASILNITNRITTNSGTNLVLDPGGDNAISGKVVVRGDLQVDGTQTIINSTVMSVNDKNLVLADSAADSAAADGAGITIAGANATMVYDAPTDRFIFNKGIKADSSTFTTINGTTISTSTLTTSNLARDPTVDSGVYGSSTLIPVLTVNQSGFIDSIGTTLVAGVTGLLFDSAKGKLTITTADGGVFNSTIADSDFTKSRAREALNVVDAGGDGSFTYDSARGKFTYTGPSASEVRAHLSASNSLTYDNATGDFRLPQPLDSAARPTFKDLTLGLPASHHIDITGTATKIKGIANPLKLTSDHFSRSVEIQHNEFTKLKTLTTGVDVTGTINADSGTFTNLTRAATVDSATYGSATKIPVLTVNTSGFVDSIGTVTVAGVSSTSFDSSTGIFTINTADGNSFPTHIQDSADLVRISRASLSGGTGVTYDNTTGQIVIGQPVGTTDSVNFSHLHADSAAITILTVDSARFNRIRIPDGSLSGNRISLGTGDDAKLYHSGMGLFIRNTTGNTALRQSTLSIQNSGGTGTYGVFNHLGLDVTGTVNADSATFTNITADSAVITDLSGTSLNYASLNTPLITGPSTLLIDPAAIGDATGTVRVLGNLTVEGTTTTINSTNVSVNDKTFTIADSAADSAGLNDAGIIWGGTSITANKPIIKYDHVQNRFDANRTINATGFVGNGSALTNLTATNLTGTIDSARIPGLAAADIVTGIIDSARLPVLAGVTGFAWDSAGTATISTPSSTFPANIRGFKDNVDLKFGTDAGINITGGTQSASSGGLINSWGGVHAGLEIQQMDRKKVLVHPFYTRFYQGTSGSEYEVFRTTDSGVKVTGQIVADSGSYDILRVNPHPSSPNPGLSIRGTAASSTILQDSCFNIAIVNNNGYIDLTAGADINLSPKHGQVGNTEGIVKLFYHHPDKTIYQNANLHFKTSKYGVTVTGPGHLTADSATFGVAMVGTPNIDDSDYLFAVSDNDSNGKKFAILAPGGVIPNFTMKGEGEQTFRFHNTSATGSKRGSFKLANRSNSDWEWIMFTDVAGNGEESLQILGRSPGNNLLIKNGVVSTNGAIEADSATISGGRLQIGGPSEDSALTFTKISGNATIKNGGKGHLFIENGFNNTGNGQLNNIYIRAKNGENSIIAQQDGAVFLYYNGIPKAQTTNGGFQITGTATADTFSGSGASLTNLPASSLTGIIDSARIPVIPIANDAHLLDGLNSTQFLRSDQNDSMTGNLTFGADVIFDSAKGISFDKSEGALKFGDRYKALFGDGGDLEIMHTGLTSTIKDKGDGSLVLQTSNGQFIQLSGNSNVMAKFYNAGRVELNHNNIKRLETTDSGVTVTGTINAGVLEGRGGVTYDPVGGSGTDTSTNVGLALFSGKRIVLSENGYIRTIVDATWGSALQFGQSGTGAFAGTEVYGGNAGVKLKYSATTRLETTDSGVTVTGKLFADSAEFNGHISAKTATISQHNEDSGLYTTLLVGERPADDGYASIQLNYGPNQFASKIDGTASTTGIWTNANSTAGERFQVNYGSADETVVLKPLAQTRVTADKYGAIIGGRLTADSSTIAGINTSLTGAQSIIEKNGALNIRGNWIRFQKPGTNTDLAIMKPDGEVELYHNGSQKLETTKYGIDITGTVNADSATITGDITASKLRLTATGDASLSSTGHAFQSGSTSSLNIIIDGNEVLARNNGNASQLNLNTNGGLVRVGDQNEGTELSVRGPLTLTSDSSQLTTLTPTAISTFSSTTYTGGKLIITAHDHVSGARQISELLIIRDTPAGTAHATEYAQIYTSGVLATYDVDINSGNIRVLATSTSTNATTYQVSETLMRDKQ